ncbi:hypothetical protein AGMMS49992_18010 [Clostridia bacterium]|nr:hypothetical protein AGMMS49992_18010 [Clostridia bacterium]
MDEYKHSHEIMEVTPGSPAAKAGLQSGMRLVRVNGKPIRDQIDYLALTSARLLRLDLDSDGGSTAVIIRKAAAEQPVGLTFGESMRIKTRRCRNRCVFCFVDQLPPNMRPPLYVKDDDWRLSLLMGNYVTLTNLSDAEFQRLLRRKARPLYLSIHTLDADLRGRMLGLPPDEADIRGRLDALRQHRLQFHAQIVLCPGWNDGEELSSTISELAAYYPTARSVAVVPVGLTRHREGLSPLLPVSAQNARETLAVIDRHQREYRERFGTAFVFASDEMYIIAGEPIPNDSAYESYPQIENGVGLLRKFAVEFEEAGETADALCVESSKKSQPPVIATGTAAAPFLRSLIQSVRPDVIVQPIVNRFLGESVTVAGLVTFADLREQLAGIPAGEVWIPESMLSADGVFLDDRTPDELSEALGVPVRVLPCDGGALRRALGGNF